MANCTHTYEYVCSCDHYKNLQIAKEKSNNLILKVNNILRSLDESSGIEIDKIKSDLEKVKNAFRTLNTSIDERRAEMEGRAHSYDRLYDIIKEKCDQKQKIGEKSYTTDYGCSIVLLWGSKSDTLHKKEYFYDEVNWIDDGYMSLIIKTVKTSVARQSQDSFVFSENFDKMKETSQKKETVYHDSFKVPYDGNVDISMAGEGTYWMDN